MIELRHLTIGYGEKAVLSDINLSLEASRLVCLLGSNGVGKSTLLRTLAGFLQPLSGKVLIGGKDISTLSLSERSKAVSVVLTERVEVPYMKNIPEVVPMKEVFMVCRACGTKIVNAIEKIKEEMKNDVRSKTDS